MYLGAIRDETEHELLRFCGVFGPEHVHAVRLEGGRGPSHAGVVRHRPVATLDRLIEVCLKFHHRATLSLGEWLTSLYLRLQIPYTRLIAYASTFRSEPRRTAQAHRCGRATEQPGSRGLGRPAAGTRLADAPARDGPREADRPGAGRLRRARPAGTSRWGTSHDGARGPGLQLTVGPDPPGRPARRRRPRSS